MGVSDRQWGTACDYSASASTSEKDIHYAVEAVAQIVGEMTDS